MNEPDLIVLFLDAMRTRKNLSRRTLKAYDSDLRAFRCFLGSKQLRTAGTPDLQAFVSYLENEGLCASSIKRKLAALKVFYRFLHQEKLVAQVPTWNTSERYRIPKQLPRVIPRREVIRILAAAHLRASIVTDRTPTKVYSSIRDVLIVEMLFSLGLRIDELTSLDVDDVDVHGGSVVVHGKGRKERLLYLSSSEVRELISRYLPLRNAIALTRDALFLNRLGTRLGNSSVGRIFTTLCSEAGVERHYTPHCMRHTMATMLIENGADVRSVQEILGHSSISTTEIYLHVSQKRKEQVLGRFNERNNMTLLLG